MMHVETVKHYQVQLVFGTDRPEFEVKDLGPIKFAVLRITRRNGSELPRRVSGVGVRAGHTASTTVKFKFEGLPPYLQDVFKREWDKLTNETN